jgi:hypothetical protein
MLEHEASTDVVIRPTSGLGWPEKLKLAFSEAYFDVVIICPEPAL